MESIISLYTTHLMKESQNMMKIRTIANLNHQC
jgi:hypothetical protein